MAPREVKNEQAHFVLIPACAIFAPIFKNMVK